MFFVVIMAHPDGPEWGEHVHAHVGYLKAKEAEGKIRASGQVTGRPLRSGMYIASVADRHELDALVAEDPFSSAGLIQEITIIEWKPFIGLFAFEIEAPDFYPVHSFSLSMSSRATRHAVCEHPEVARNVDVLCKSNVDTSAFL